MLCNNLKHYQLVLHGDHFQLGVFDKKKKRSNRMVCGFSPERKGGDVQLLRLLQASGMVVLHLEKQYRFDPPFFDLLRRLRVGDFFERERSELIAAGADVGGGIEMETVEYEIGGKKYSKAWQCFTDAKISPVLFYSNFEVERYTLKMQKGLKAIYVKCVDEEGGYDTSIFGFLSDKELAGYLEGAVRCLTLTKDCPVKLERNIADGHLQGSEGEIIK